MPRPPDTPPLVLLHGGGADSSSWKPVLDRLHDGIRVVALDLPGHGGAKGLAYGPTVVADLADAVAADIQDRDLGRPHVVGHSLGGAVALEVTRRVPVAAVTALAPIGFWTPCRGRAAAAVLRNGSRLARALPASARARLMARPVLRGPALALFSTRPSSIGAHDATALADALSASDIISMSRYTGRYRFRSRAAIPAPVVLVWAGRDRLVVPGDAARAARLLPRAAHLLVPDSGHLVMHDAPDTVVHIITSMWQEGPRTGSA